MIDESGERVFDVEWCEHHGVHFGSVECVHCWYAAPDEAASTVLESAP